MENEISNEIVKERVVIAVLTKKTVKERKKNEKEIRKQRNSKGFAHSKNEKKSTES